MIEYAGDYSSHSNFQMDSNQCWIISMLVWGPEVWLISGGYGELNEELLYLLSTNKATVCNTCFKKRDICKQTWQHPKSKR